MDGTIIVDPFGDFEVAGVWEEADDNALDKMRGAFILRHKANTVEECFMIAEEAISVEWLLNSLADYQLHLTKKANELEN